MLRQLAAAQATDCVSAVARVEHQLARCEGQMQQVTLDLARHLELSFADLLTVVRPSGQQLLVDKQGHKLVRPGRVEGGPAACLRLPALGVAAWHAPERWGVLSSSWVTCICASVPHPLPSSFPTPQGYLEFDSLNKIDVLLRELPDSYASKQHAVAHGVDLCFCYANPIPGAAGLLLACLGCCAVVAAERLDG